jgi:outer membrane protein TolC
MTEKASNTTAGEQKLVKAYMDLTGSPESSARGVLMFVCTPEGATATSQGDSEINPVMNNGNGDNSAKRQPARALMVVLPFLILLLAACQAAAAGSTNFISSPLSLADAVNLALQQNPSILKAQKELEATQGVIIQTRAVALPNVAVGGSYSAAQASDVDTFQAPGVTFGTPQNWSTQIKLVQSLYAGGRILSSFRVAQLLKQQSLLNYRTTVADAILLVQLAYYDVLLAADQIAVQEASVELLTRELTDTTRRYEAGTVPRFNVLRAEVELANARPKLSNARSNLRISKNRLANLLGFNVPPDAVEDIPLNLSGKLEAEPYEVDLPRAVMLALARRTELESLRKTQALRKEDVINARAGYKPTLQGFVGYDVHNSILSMDIGDELHGWIGGAQLTWNIFDGLHTRGRVVETTANFERAQIDLDDAARRIQLDVRTAHSIFVEAKEVLESQKKVVEQGEEALRLARARSEAGTGTQLDVLSAQTALTDARNNQVQALHDYEAARARLLRAVGMNIPSEPLPEPR